MRPLARVLPVLAVLISGCPPSSTGPVTIGGSSAPIGSVSIPGSAIPGVNFTYFGHARDNNYYHPGTLYICGRSPVETALCSRQQVTGLLAHPGQWRGPGDVTYGVKFDASADFPAGMPGGTIRYVQFVKHWFCIEYPGGRIECARADDKWRLDDKLPWDNQETGNTPTTAFLEDSPEFDLTDVQRRDAIKARAFWDFKTLVVLFSNLPNGERRAQIIGRATWRVKLAVMKQTANAGTVVDEAPVATAPAGPVIAAPAPVAAVWVWDPAAGGGQGAYGFTFDRWSFLESGLGLANLEPTQETVQDVINNWSFQQVAAYPPYPD